VSTHVTTDSMNCNFVPQSTKNRNKISIASQPGTSLNNSTTSSIADNSLLIDLNVENNNYDVVESTIGTPHDQENEEQLEEPIRDLNSEKENFFENIIVWFIKGSNTSNNTLPKPKSRKRLCPNSEILSTKEYLEKRKVDEEKKNALEQKEKRKREAIKKRKAKNLLLKRKCSLCLC
jgi:hypothetical protein